MPLEVWMNRPTGMFGQKMVHIALFEGAHNFDVSVRSEITLLKSTFNSENFIMPLG